MDFRLAVLLMVGIALTYVLAPDALASATTLMPRIKELLTLAKQCYAQANDTLHPEAKKTLQDIGNGYAQKADELRRTQITQAVFPNDKK